MVVPYAAGSATDLVPRTVFEQVGRQVGQSFVVENRPGGGTTIGSAQVKQADPDGHTILVHSNAIVTVPAIQPNVPYDPVKDFSGLTPLGNVPLVLVVAPSKGMKTLKELVDKAKAKPGEINYAAAGIGTPPHLAMERFRLAAGFEGQLVPFKGAPEALTEVMTGRVDIYFCPITPALPLIRDGKLLALAVSSSQACLGVAGCADHRRGRRAGFRSRFLGRRRSCRRRRRATWSPRCTARSSRRSTIRRPRQAATLGVEPMIMEPDAFDARIAKEADIAKKLAKAAKIEPQ